MSMTTAQAKAYLLGLLPVGFTSWFDFSTGSFGDLILEGAAERFAACVANPTDTVEADSNPSTLTATGLAAWEAVIGITSVVGKTAAQRQAAILARLREFGGASTLPAIKSIIGGILGYANPLAIQVIEQSRSALTSAHTYENGAGLTIVGGGTQTATVNVPDGAKVSQAGATLILTSFTASDLTDATITLTGPDATAKAWGGAPYVKSGGDLRLYGREFADAQVGGTWTLSIHSASHDMDLDHWDLFVEGIGWQGATGGAQGLGAAIFEWSVLVDPALAGVTCAPDYALALATLQRIKPAHTQAYLVKKMTGGGSVAIYDDANAVEDSCTYA